MQVKSCVKTICPISLKAHLSTIINHQKKGLIVERTGRKCQEVSVYPSLTRVTTPTQQASVPSFKGRAPGRWEPCSSSRTQSAGTACHSSGAFSQTKGKETASGDVGTEGREHGMVGGGNGWFYFWTSWGVGRQIADGANEAVDLID